MTAPVPARVVIGTRGSALARWQADHVAAELARVAPGLQVTQQIIVTEGDRFQTGPVIERGGKGVWVKEIEAALLAGTIDLAVHSLKDVPAELAEGLALAAIPPRADPRDVLISRQGHVLGALPAGSRVGAKGAASSERDPPSRIISATILPVAGAVSSPHEPCAVARNVPGAQGTGPMSGRPSTVIAR